MIFHVKISREYSIKLTGILEISWTEKKQSFTNLTTL